MQYAAYICNRHKLKLEYVSLLCSPPSCTPRWLYEPYQHMYGVTVTFLFVVIFRWAHTVDTGVVSAYVGQTRAHVSVVLDGRCLGRSDSIRSTTGGDSDFAAVAIHQNEEQLWRWQIPDII